ncbi:MAG TPA: hypothetical protein VI230_09475 [Ignavibacteriaceae bacterium]
MIIEKNPERSTNFFLPIKFLFLWTICPENAIKRLNLDHFYNPGSYRLLLYLSLRIFFEGRTSVGSPDCMGV